MFTRRYFGVPKKSNIKKLKYETILENSKEDEYKEDEYKEDEYKDGEYKEDEYKEGLDDWSNSERIISIGSNSEGLDNRRNSERLISIGSNSEGLDDRRNLERLNSIGSNLEGLDDWMSNNRSLKSSVKSKYIIPISETNKSNNIYKRLKKINKLGLEIDYIQIKSSDDEYKKEVLIRKINLIKPYISGFLKDFIINTLSYKYLEDLMINISKSEKSPEYKKKYIIYKDNLNQLLKSLDIIIGNIKTNLTARYLKQYKHELINNINNNKKKIKEILSQLLKTYNKSLPYYKKKWWGGKTRKNRKWSNKYKKSINCKNPKGFSQKQYCKSKTKKLR